jgi:hypothetical protein
LACSIVVAFGPSARDPRRPTNHDDDVPATPAKEFRDMKRLVRYKVKADQVAENERLIREVYAELAWEKPRGLHYATFRLDDGVSFVHVVSYDSDAASQALTSLPAFKAFTAGIRQRCDELPVTVELAEIGSYEFFGTRIGTGA